MTVLGWHFLGDNGKLRDGTDPPPNGEWIEHTGQVEMCKAGLHFSRRAIDALCYAPGAVICRVECDDIVFENKDKAVCRKRRILWRADANDTLRAFARACALDVIDKWSAPAVVREYLETGDKSLRAAAWAAAAYAAAYAADAAAAAAAYAAAAAAAWATAAAYAAASAATAERDAARTAQNERLEAMLTALAPRRAGEEE